VCWRGRGEDGALENERLSLNCVGRGLLGGNAAFARAGAHVICMVDIVSARQEVFMVDFLKEHGFVGVLLMASYPNALFDMCGLCCGHFMMPMHQFLIATVGCRRPDGDVLGPQRIECVRFLKCYLSQRRMRAAVPSLTPLNIIIYFRSDSEQCTFAVF
jgi:hypothetical protein